MVVILDYYIGASPNDGSGYSLYITDATTFYIGSYGTWVYNTHLFFTGVIIPPGAIITNAYFSLYLYGVEGTVAPCDIWFEKNAAPVVVTSRATWDAKSKTINTVSWTPTGDAGWNNSGNLATILQEIVDAYDCSAGISIQVLIRGTGTGSNRNRYYTWDYSDHSRAPILHIEYTVGPAIPILTSQFRRRWS